ncbi:MAG: hypothetical protein ABIK43_03535 [candidate division WOR-3 bacterium]
MTRIRTLCGLILLAGLAWGWFASAWSFSNLSWSPDGRYLCLGAYCSAVGDGEVSNGEDFILIIPVDSAGCWRPLLPSRHSAYPSNAGDQVALAGSAGIFVLNLTRDSLTHLFSPFSPDAYYDRTIIDCLTWAPDDGRLAFSVWDDGPMTAELYLIDLTLHTVTRPLSEEQLATCGRIRSLRWQNQGTILLCCSNRDSGAESTLLRLDVSTCRLSPAPPHVRYGIRPDRPTVRLVRDTLVSTTVTEYQPDFATPHSRSVSDTILDYVIVVDFPDRPDRSFRPPIVQISSIQNGEVSPDGRLVYFEWSRTNSECNVEAQAELYTIDGYRFEGTYAGNRPLWLKGGNRLLSHNRSGYAVTRTDGRGRFVPVNGELRQIVLSPDSTRIALELMGEFGPSIGVSHIDSSSYRSIRGLCSPRWIAGGRMILCRSEEGYVLLDADGSPLCQSHLTNFGHSPRWVTDSVILFRAGESFTGNEEDNTARWYRSDEPLWQLNVLAGRMRPACTELLNLYEQTAQASTADTLLSPDGRHLAWIESRRSTARLWLSARDGSNPRLMLDAWANYRPWLDSNDSDNEE